MLQNTEPERTGYRCSILQLYFIQYPLRMKYGMYQDSVVLIQKPPELTILRIYTYIKKNYCMHYAYFT